MDLLLLGRGLSGHPAHDHALDPGGWTMMTVILMYAGMAGSFSLVYVVRHLLKKPGIREAWETQYGTEGQDMEIMTHCTSCGTFTIHLFTKRSRTVTGVTNALSPSGEHQTTYYRNTIGRECLACGTTWSELLTSDDNTVTKPWNPADLSYYENQVKHFESELHVAGRWSTSRGSDYYETKYKKAKSRLRDAEARLKYCRMAGPQTSSWIVEPGEQKGVTSFDHIYPGQ